MLAGVYITATWLPFHSGQLVYAYLHRVSTTSVNSVCQYQCSSTSVPINMPTNANSSQAFCQCGLPLHTSTFISSPRSPGFPRIPLGREPFSASIVRAFCCSLLLALPSVSVSPLLSPLQCPSPVSISVSSPASLLHTRANPHNRAYRKGKSCREPRLCHPHHWFCDSFASEEIERIKQLGRSKLSTGWISLVLVSVGLLNSFCSSSSVCFHLPTHNREHGRRPWRKVRARAVRGGCAGTRATESGRSVGYPYHLCRP